MYQFIEQLASDADISIHDANHVFSVITCHLKNKIPALDQVLDGVFSGAGPEKLKMHLNNMVTTIQQQEMEKFKTWIMPEELHTIKHSGSDLIL